MTGGKIIQPNAGGKSSPTKFMPLLEGERKKIGKRKKEIEA